LRPGTTLLDCWVVLERELDGVIQGEWSGRRGLGNGAPGTEHAADRRQPNPTPRPDSAIPGTLTHQRPSSACNVRKPLLFTSRTMPNSMLSGIAPRRPVLATLRWSSRLLFH